MYSTTEEKGKGEETSCFTEYQLMNVGGMTKLEKNHLNLIIN